MKIRLDQLLVERGLAETREKAQRLIRAGLVWLGEGPRATRGEKPGLTLPADALVELRGSDCPYVSRGGLKLAAALQSFNFTTREGQLYPPQPATRNPQPVSAALDLGASTGGFTDCLLQAGVPRVWTFDSGTNQLHERLRNDPRVRWRESANARELTPQWIEGDTINLCVIDVSFISLRLVLPPVAAVLAPTGSVVALVKPQFEAGPADVGRGGVVRDPAIHRRVLAELAAWCAAHGWALQALCPSPLRGPAGNVEFFFHLYPSTSCLSGLSGTNLDNAIEQALSAAYNAEGR